MNKDNAKTDKEIKKEIGENIKRIRRSSRSFLSAQKVADKLKITRSSLTQIENGNNNVNAVTLWKLSCILDCDMKDFFPNTPDGFQISKKDIEEVEKKDKKAKEWAKQLFGEPKNNKQE